METYDSNDSVEAGRDSRKGGSSWQEDDFEAGGSLRETSDIFADKEKVSWVWLTYGKEKLEKAYPKLCLRRSIYKKRRKAKKHS